MKTKSAGVIIFRKDNNKIYYLVLKYNTIGKVDKTYWGFAKGTIEENEKEIETIVREAEEETGINDLNFIKGFKEKENYFFKNNNKTVFKTVVYLLAETKTKEIKLSYEHLDYKWLVLEEAVKILTFDNSKNILIKANNSVKNLKTP